MKQQRGMVAIVFLGFLVLMALVGALLWPYSINAWLVFFGKAPVVVWWHGVLLGFCPIIGHATLPVALITFVLMLILT